MMVLCAGMIGAAGLMFYSRSMGRGHHARAYIHHEEQQRPSDQQFASHFFYDLINERIPLHDQLSWPTWNCSETLEDQLSYVLFLSIFQMSSNLFPGEVIHLVNPTVKLFGKFFYVG